MNVLLYLLGAVAVVVVYAIVVWARNRQPSSLESGVDAFQREMQALSPEAAPIRRRPGATAGGPDDGQPPAARAGVRPVGPGVGDRQPPRRPPTVGGPG